MKKEVITIEAQIADTAMGDLVMSEMEIDKQRGEKSIIGDNPLTEDMELLVKKLFEKINQAVLGGAQVMDLVPLGINQLNKLTDVCHYQVDDTSTTSNLIK